jgi:hypothetical protein
VAVDRAVFGDPSSGPQTLRPSEQQAALRRLAGSLPNDQIARRLGMATRTVVRHRMSQGLPAYTPAPPIDGLLGPYRQSMLPQTRRTLEHWTPDLGTPQEWSGTYAGTRVGCGARLVG